MLERTYSEGTLLVALSTQGLHSVSMLASKKKTVVQSHPLELASTETSSHQVCIVLDRTFFLKVAVFS